MTDGSITTSRSPEDLPAICQRSVPEFAGVAASTAGRPPFVSGLCRRHSPRAAPR
jgi:hypothetical protein